MSQTKLDLVKVLYADGHISDEEYREEIGKALSRFAVVLRKRTDGGYDVYDAEGVKVGIVNWEQAPLGGGVCLEAEIGDFEGRLYVEDRDIWALDARGVVTSLVRAAFVAQGDDPPEVVFDA